MLEELEDRVIRKNVDQADKNRFDILLPSLTVRRTRRHFHMNTVEAEGITIHIRVM